MLLVEWYNTRDKANYLVEVINLDNKDKNEKKRLSRVELYDSPKSQKRSFFSKKRARRSNTPLEDEQFEPVHSRRRQIVDRPQKSHHGFFSRFFNGRHNGKLYKTILFALLGVLVVMIIVFAVKQQHPVNTDSTDTSVSSSSSSHHSRKHKRSHSSDSDDDDYGDNENQATYQVPASRSDNNGNGSQNQNNGGSNSNNNSQSSPSNGDNSHSAPQPQQPQPQQPAPKPAGGGQTTK